MFSKNKINEKYEKILIGDWFFISRFTHFQIAPRLWFVRIPTSFGILADFDVSSIFWCIWWLEFFDKEIHRLTWSVNVFINRISISFFYIHSIMSWVDFSIIHKRIIKSHFVNKVDVRSILLKTVLCVRMNSKRQFFYRERFSGPHSGRARIDNISNKPAIICQIHVIMTWKFIGIDKKIKLYGFILAWGHYTVPCAWINQKNMPHCHRCAYYNWSLFNSSS